MTPILSQRPSFIRILIQTTISGHKEQIIIYYTRVESFRIIVKKEFCPNK